MKKIKLLALLSLVLTFSGCKPVELSDFENDYDISVMSYNIRYDNEEDGANKWDNRKHACLDMINETNPSIFGIQEGLYNQVTFLNDNLQDYEYVGVGRDDGQTAGEYCAIYYSTDQFELLETGSFWLSETPDVPSLGWDANNIRIVTWAKLKDVLNNKTIYVFNTHFDHKGKTAREESAKLLVQKIQEITKGDVPVFITGDFNVLIGDSILEPIIDEYFSARRFADRSDNNNSFNAWGRWYLSSNIDFIFYNYGKTLSFKTVVKDYGVSYISDHYPIITHFNYQ